MSEEYSHSDSHHESIEGLSKSILHIDIHIKIAAVFLAITWIYFIYKYMKIEDQVKKIKDRIASNNYQMITIEHL